MNYLDELKMRLLFLKRPHSEHYPEATTKEKLDTLIECCAILLSHIPSQSDDDEDYD